MNKYTNQNLEFLQNKMHDVGDTIQIYLKYEDQENLAHQEEKKKIKKDHLEITQMFK